MKPAKLIVVPGAVLGELKVHLLSENGEPKLVGVQLQLQVTPGNDDDDNGDDNGDDDDDDNGDDDDDNIGDRDGHAAVFGDAHHPHRIRIRYIALICLIYARITDMKPLLPHTHGHP